MKTRVCLKYFLNDSGYQENPAKPGSLIFSDVGFSWVSSILKNCKLGLAGLLGF